MNFVVIRTFTRCACAICFTEKVILTGGLKTLDKVTVYNSKGWVEDLPSLKIGRYYHACGSFVTSDKKMVSLELNNVILASDICYIVIRYIWWLEATQTLPPQNC